MISTCSQSAPWSIVFAHSAPNFAKSAERIEGAMIALGAMFDANWNIVRWVNLSDIHVVLVLKADR